MLLTNMIIYQIYLLAN